jgi:hypothetical protein
VPDAGTHQLGLEGFQQLRGVESLRSCAAQKGAWKAVRSGS